MPSPRGVPALDDRKGQRRMWGVINGDTAHGLWWERSEKEAAKRHAIGSHACWFQAKTTGANILTTLLERRTPSAVVLVLGVGHVLAASEPSHPLKAGQNPRWMQGRMYGAGAREPRAVCTGVCAWGVAASCLVGRLYSGSTQHHYPCQQAFDGWRGASKRG